MIREDRMRGYAAALPHIRAAIKAYHEATRPTVVTDEVVERVARALCRQYEIDDGFSEEQADRHAASPMWLNFRRAARAAIAAMSSQEGE